MVASASPTRSDGRTLIERIVAQLAHRDLLQRPPRQDGALQRVGGEHAQARRLAGRIAHQDVGGALLLEQPHHGDDVGVRVDQVRRPHEGLVDARHVQRLQLVAALALAGGAELGAQVGKQQRAERGVGGDQVVDGLARQRIGHHLLDRHEAAAGLAGHQGAAVEAVVRPVGGHQILAVELLHHALDDDEQVRGRRADVEDHLVGPVIGDVHVVAHLALLVLRQAVEGRGVEVEGVGHGSGRAGGSGQMVKKSSEARAAAQAAI
ncbi:hypothetical protein MASR1M50_22190 [Burkholderiales bacterium]